MNCLVFDIETVPDVALGRRLYTQDEREARAKRFRAQRRRFVRAQHAERRATCVS